MNFSVWIKISQAVVRDPSDFHHFLRFIIQYEEIA